MRALFPAFAILLGLAVPSFAQSTDDRPLPLPEKRLTVIRNTDFPGGDIQSIFDTNYRACADACLAATECRALTFNERSNACFLKSGSGAETAFNGATSARVLDTDARLLAGADSRLDDLGFLGTGDLTAALSFNAAVSEEFSPGSWTLQQLNSAAAEARSSGNIADAILYSGAAVTMSDNSELWTEYGRLMLVKPTDNSGSKQSNAAEALRASVGAYMRARTGGARVAALLVMADALEAVERGSDMIPALRLAQSIQPRPDVETALKSALGKYGFRITETQVDSDLASPRICATFSAEVLSGGSDYASFVTIDQGDPIVTSEGRQICVEGLEHGKRYRVAFRPGLTSASGEELVKPAELSLYVRDRSPSVRFPGRGYILPASGEVALPITGVNATEVDLRLRRVSDRNLIRTIQNDYFGRPLNYYAEEYFADEIAEDIWKGTGVLNTELNRDVTTRLPLGDVIEGLDPGIYVLQASIPEADPYDNPAATQWFVVSDIGLASISGNDGLHVFARSLATAAETAGVKVSLISRSNSVLATAVTDDRGHVRFDAGLGRGTGGPGTGDADRRGRRRPVVPAADRPRVRPVRSWRRGQSAGDADRRVPDHRPRRLSRRRDDQRHRADPRCQGGRAGRAADDGGAVPSRRRGVFAADRRGRGRRRLRVQPADHRNRAARDLAAGPLLGSRRAGAGVATGAGRGFPARAHRLRPVAARRPDPRRRPAGPDHRRALSVRRAGCRPEDRRRDDAARGARGRRLARLCLRPPRHCHVGAFRGAAL